IAAGRAAGRAAGEIALHMHGQIGRDRGAAFQRRDVDQLGLLAVGGRPVIGAAGGVWADAPRHLVVVRIGRLGVELEVLGGIVFDRLAGLGIDALGPGHLIDMLGGLEELAVAAVENVFKAVAARMGDDLAILAVHLGVEQDVGAGLVVVAVVVGRVLEIPADLAVGGIEREHARGVEVVARTARRVIARNRV